jgi:putative IMPACT (imprinted ancient) family translation regulator
MNEQKKGKFQAHVAQVKTTAEVDLVISNLMQNKKIREATHNITAFRIQAHNTMVSFFFLFLIISNFFLFFLDKIENRDDDGETGAGDKVLFMLQQKNAKNILVVVTRWFGGIKLGNDRFKHITNVAKELVEQVLGDEQQTRDQMEETETSKKSKKKEKKK